MNKGTKNLLLVAGADVSLLALVAVVLEKFRPISLTDLVNHCRGFSQSIIFHLPHIFWSVMILTSIFILALTVIRFISGLVYLRGLTRKLSSNRRLVKRFMKATDRLGLSNAVYLIADDRLLAFCAGVFQPKIFVSTGLLQAADNAELMAVLLHEQYHIQSHDSLTMMLAYFGRSLFPFFPVFGDFIAKLRLEREMEADRAAIASVDSLPLIRILRKFLQSPSVNLAFNPALGNFEGLERRIKALLTKKDDNDTYCFKTRNIIISFIAVIVLLGITFSPVEAIEFHGNSQDVMLVCVKSNYPVSASYSIPASSPLTRGK